MKIWTCCPKPFFPDWMEDWVFFSRDMGLTCYALRELGVESQVVLMKGDGKKEHPDILRADIEQMEDPEWWGQFGLDAVVLGAWASPEYTPVAKAIKESGAKLIVRCDHGGVYSQRQQSLWQSFYGNHLKPRYQGKNAAYAWIYSALKTPWHLATDWYARAVMVHMSYADLIMSEAPEGVRYLKEFLCSKGRTEIASRVKYVPHPIANSDGYDTAVPKERRIIAVGRWENYQKNAPLLIRSLERVLTVHLNYEAHIFGGGEDVLKRLLARVPNDVGGRFHIHGSVPNYALVEEYQKSRVFFAPSRSESFNIAAAEALACGCSLVGSGQIFSFRNFVSKNSGTLARRYCAKGMAEALVTEIFAWDEGLRNSEQLAGVWKEEFVRTAIANLIFETVQN